MNKFHLKVACFFILFIVALVTSLYSTNIILKNEGLLLALGTLIICISPKKIDSIFDRLDKAVKSHSQS